MLLALDTSTRRIGIAVFDGTRILTETTWTSPFHHTAELAPAVESAFRRTGLTASDLAAIGVATGPGSFTALRTGLAFVKGLALARGTPLVGISSLDVIAAAQPRMDTPLIAVLEAGRKRLAAGRYIWADDRWQFTGVPALLTPEELAASLEAPTWVCGELDAKALSALSASPHARLAPAALNVRRPGVLAELAWARFANGEADDPVSLAPQYLSTGGAEA